jgi:ubiquitin-like 1-activating enzyme E1 B
MNKFVENQLKHALPATRILLVGVGGIGCEILKYLSKSQLGSLYLVDFDHIELSNLNRQFYFRQEHIGRSKAEVAAEIMKEMAPTIEIKVYNSSIFESQFDSSFFSKFDAVILALDNAEARSHVNKQCLKTGTVVFESGTHGFSGQTYAILPGLSRCYDCFPREAPKTMQICTIRTFPKKPEHCLFWAKNVFSNLFNETQATADQSFSIVESAKKLSETNGPDFAINFLKGIYHENIEGLKQTEGTKFSHVRSIDSQLFDRLPEKVTQIKSLTQNANLSHFALNIFKNIVGLQKSQKNRETNRQKNSENGTTQILNNESYKLIDELLSLIALSCYFIEKLSKNNQSFSFDKDEDDHTILVIALSNLRSFNFGIDMKDHEEGRKLLGNIIPALSSTNALVAGLLVQEMFKHLLKTKCQDSKKNLLSLKNFELYVSNFRVPKIIRGNLTPPNDICSLCQTEKNFISVNFQSSFKSLKEFISNKFFPEFNVFYKSNLLFEAEEVDAALIENPENSSVVSTDSSDFDFSRTIKSIGEMTDLLFHELELLVVHIPKISEPKQNSKLVSLIHDHSLPIDNFECLDTFSNIEQQKLLKELLSLEKIQFQTAKEAKKRTPSKEFSPGLAHLNCLSLNLEYSNISVQHSSNEDSVLIANSHEPCQKKIHTNELQE